MKIKIGVLFLLIFSVQQADSQNSPVSPLERKITLEAVNMPVSKVLKQIEKETRLRFSYNSEITEGLKPVTASFRNKKISEIVFLLFDDKIKCKIKNNYIILYPNSKTPSHNVSKNSPGGKNDNEKSSSKKELSKNAVVPLKTLKNDRDTSVYYPDSTAVFIPPKSDSIITMDSISLLPTPLLLINNDTTLLLLEEDTTATPK